MFFSRAAGLKYVHRGDHAVNDFTKTDFTQDNAWHDLDLSCVVPKGEVLVHLSLLLAEPESYKYIYFRKKGLSNDVNIFTAITQAPNVPLAVSFFIVPNNNAVVEYKAQNVTWTYINLNIRGWFV